MAAACYGLITFEFLYMASPFAAYLYAAYGPGLNVVNDSATFGRLGQVFLPHISVQTRNPLINLHNPVGAVLVVVGLAGFCLGAFQVYRNKLFRKGAVLGGVYAKVRHPQYTCLAVSGVGMLLLWPRYVVLLSFVGMLFVYYLLARVEEKECVTKFGQSYLDYRQRTHMFLPFRPPLAGRLRRLTQAGPLHRLRPPRHRLARVAAGLALYAVASASAVGLAAGVNELTIRSLYTTSTPTAVYLSVDRIDAAKLDRIVAVARDDDRVRAAVERLGPDARFINYVVPDGRYVSETLMAPQPGGDASHFLGSTYRGDRYRVVFTHARLREPASGRAILVNTAGRTPVLEAVVDVRTGRVAEVSPPHTGHRYNGVPVPVY